MLDSETPRFMIDQLKRNPRAPNFPHFIPIPKDVSKGTKDRFGNRIFSSNTYSTVDRGGRESKAALLVSAAGEKFIKKNAGILHDIEKGLSALTTTTDPKSPTSTEGIIELGNGRTMRKFSGGSQSYVFTLEIGNKQYIVKTRRNISAFGEVLYQPFINEMLQVQSIENDLKDTLRQQNVRMPRYLFASSYVSIREYEEGKEPSPKDIRNIEKQLVLPVEQYIQRQLARGNHVWENIKLERVQITEPELSEYNFIKSSDGMLVWIDPFYYPDS